MDKIKRDKLLHYIMSFIGGNFAIYSLLEHSNVFGSAETSNMILLVENILHFDLFHILIRLGSLLVYACGIAFSVWMSKYRKKDRKSVCLIVDAFSALALWLLPLDVNPIIALYPVAFSMSIQWCTFKGVNGNPSATTFSTGNFRQLVTNIFNFFDSGSDDAFCNIKFYLITMLSFHMGVAVIYIIWQYIPHESILFVLIPITVAFALEKYYEKKKEASVELLSQSSGCEDV